MSKIKSLIVTQKLTATLLATQPNHIS